MTPQYSFRSIFGLKKAAFWAFAPCFNNFPMKSFEKMKKMKKRFSQKNHGVNICVNG
jgi:hypothetical protein